MRKSGRLPALLLSIFLVLAVQSASAQSSLFRVAPSLPVAGLFPGISTTGYTDSNGALWVDCFAGCSGGGGGASTSNQGTAGSATAAWYVQPGTGATWNVTQGTNPWTVGGTVTVGAITAALPAGTNNIGSVNQGTSPWLVSASSLPLPAGAATAANQTSVQGSAVGGTAASASELDGGIFNTTLPTLTSGQQAAVQLDTNARTLLSPPAAGAWAGSIGYAAGSASSSAFGTPLMGATAASAPSYAAGQVQLVTLSAAGGLLTSISTFTGTVANVNNSLATLNATSQGGLHVTQEPSVDANTGIVPITTTNSALVAKTAAGNLFGYDLQEGATSGYFVFLNLTAVPAASATLVPINCIFTAANQHISIRTVMPDTYATGITIASSSSCTTYTAVASTFIAAEVK